MIDALIYDMGNVLVRWDPHALALAGSADPADASVLEKALFASPDWIKGDLGLFGPEEMFAAARLRVPARLGGFRGSGQQAGAEGIPAFQRLPPLSPGIGPVLPRLFPAGRLGGLRP